MLKVLQLIPTLDRSGAEKQMVILAKGLPRDRFQVEVAALTRSGPLEAELDAAGVPVTVIGKSLKLDPIALAPPDTIPRGQVVRRGPDLDLRGEHLWAGRVSAGRGPGSRGGGDGRGPVEGAFRPARRPPAGDLVRSPGRQLARGRRLLSRARGARRPAGDDLLRNRRRGVAIGSTRVRSAPSSDSRPRHRWSCSPAGWPSRSVWTIS